MLLKKVAIENFRGIKNISMELDRTTILIGENNTGKTSVLKAIHFCLGRSLGRRTTPFEEYDYYLDSKEAIPPAAPPISITLNFVEEKEGEWPDQVVQALDKAAVIRDDGLQEVRLRVTSSYDKITKEYILGWDFLNPKDEPLAAARNPKLLSELQQLNPAFFLEAVRDASQQFMSKSPFWGPFTRNLQIDDAARQELEEQVESINQAILDAHKPFEEVKAKIARAGTLVPLAKADLVSVEAVPARIFDILSKSQVKLAAATGAKLPVGQHGAGTQSLSVIFLFEAFISNRLAEVYDKYSEPLLTLEEPEAHLHPSAIRSLWSILDGITGQKIVATHSGELLAGVPLKSIRRLARKDGQIRVFRVGDDTLTPDEDRKVGYHIRSRRGGLLFARCWLLVEGESEFWFLPEAARLLGYDLELEGICCVEFAQCGLDPLIKIARDLGIEWHVLTDGDSAGNDYAETVRAILGADSESARISQLSERILEHALWAHGYSGVYEGSVGRRQAVHVTARPGDPSYPDQVIRMAIKSTSKPDLVLAVLEKIRENSSPGIPPVIKIAIEKAVELARRSS